MVRVVNLRSGTNRGAFFFFEGQFARKPPNYCISNRNKRLKGVMAAGAMTAPSGGVWDWRYVINC